MVQSNEHAPFAGTSSAGLVGLWDGLMLCILLVLHIIAFPPVTILSLAPIPQHMSTAGTIVVVAHTA
jgi:hypothetical protein